MKLTLDDLKLKAALAKKIAEWANESCVTDEWVRTVAYTHPNFEGQMADAAYAVFQAMYQSQMYREERS